MLRRFSAFLASSACAVSATSYHFESIAPPQKHRLYTPTGRWRPNPHRLASLTPPQGPTISLCFFWSFLHARSFCPAHFAGHRPRRHGTSQTCHHRQWPGL
nr:DUF1010 domain-containing protein [Acidovorax temperans]